METKEDLVRAHIIEKSKTVFRFNGYNKVSMEDIATATGKGRSTLYYYYKNKHEVFEGVLTEEYLDIIRPAMQQVSESNSLSDNLLNYNRTKLDALVRKADEYEYLISDIKKNPEILQRIFEKIRHREVELVTECLEWALDKQEIAPIASNDLEFLTKTMVTAARSLEKEMVLYGSIEDMRTRLKWLIQLLVKGLQ